VSATVGTTSTVPPARGRRAHARGSRTRVLTAGLAAALLAAGCTVVGPDYERPESPLPASYGAVAAGTPAGAAGESGAEASAVATDWWKRYGDPQLSALIDIALANNADVRAAVARVEEADAVAREADAAFLPSVDLGASGGRGRVTGIGAQGSSVTSNNVQLYASAAYEIDFWGRLRRTSEAARAEALASRHAQDVVRLSVAALTAQAWFSLRSLDEQLALTRRTLEAREAQLRIVRLRLDAGTASRLDLEQASTARADAAIQLRDLQRQRDLAQTLLARLVGQPGVAFGPTTTAGAAPDALSSMPVPPTPPLGLPSDLLARRPDLLQAEEQLVAANARIGVARAAMLPSISLTGSYGVQSSALASLLNSNARIWTLGFGLSLPIFDGGRLQARSDQAVARERQALAAYQGAAQSAFREVSDALIAGSAARDAEADVASRAQATRRALELASMRYEAGYSGYLEVLDAQRAANAAELEAVRNRQTRLNASVDLFRALSGGWPEPDTTTEAEK